MAELGHSSLQYLQIICSCDLGPALQGLYFLAGSEIEHNEVTTIRECHPLHAFFYYRYRQQLRYLPLANLCLV